MNRQFAWALVVLTALGICVGVSAAPENAESKKQPDKPPLPLPPFPDTAPDDVPLPPRKTELTPKTDLTPVNMTELAPAPREVTPSLAYDVIKVAPKDIHARETDEKLAIGFFNHSDRDLLLVIDNRTIKLNSHYYLQLKLPREFVWREKEGLSQTTKVPEDSDGVEIVFRK